MVLQLALIQCILDVIVVHVRHGHEVFLRLMSHHDGYQIFKFARGAEEDFTLAVLGVLLDVERDGLRYAEVFHCFRYCHTELRAQIEKMVDGMPRIENNSGMLKDRDFLLSEFLRRKALHLNKGAEHDFNAMLFGDVVVRRLFRSRLGLRH